MAINFIGEGNQSTRRKSKPPTCVSHWQTLSNNVVLSTPLLSLVQTQNASGDRHWLHR